PAKAAMLDDQSRFAYVPPDRILGLLDIPENGSMLDFGTGTGTYAIEIAQKRPDIQVLAYDEQPAMLQLLAAKLRGPAVPNVTLLDAADCQAYGARVDRVLALNVLHELGDDAVRRLLSFLKPGGFALIVDWNADVERPVGPPHDHVYTTSDAFRRLGSFAPDVAVVAKFPYHYALRAGLASPARSLP
ncbi:MAG: class I SAM-dependent methyltransferase, partial [Vulcanimicrobiaceae bacterium]